MKPGTEYHRQRRAAGFCTSCGELALAGRTRCQKHTDEAKRLGRERYLRKRAEGLCGTCKRLPAVGGLTVCERCREEHSTNEKRRREEVVAERSLLNAQLATDRTSRGMCPACGDRPVATGRVICLVCLSNQMQESGMTRHEARKRLGLCQNCDQPAAENSVRCPRHNEARQERVQQQRANGLCPNDSNPVAVGKHRCQVCLDRSKERYRSRASRGLCSNCGSRPPITGQKQCSECRESGRQVDARKRQKLKDAVFTAYGGYVCRCCGEANPDFLQIDHVNNDGYKHRKEIGGCGGTRLYTWLRKNKYPPGFQVLCVQCNWAKRKYGECPHETARRKASATIVTDRPPG